MLKNLLQKQTLQNKLEKTKKLLLVLLMLSIASCGGMSKKQHQTVVSSSVKIKAKPPRPEPVVTLQTPWFLILDDDEPLIMCLPEKGFENLGLNGIDMLRYINNQKALIKFYESEK